MKKNLYLYGVICIFIAIILIFGQTEFSSKNEISVNISFDVSAIDEAGFFEAGNVFADKSDTVLQVTKRVLNEKNIGINVRDGYVYSINGISEFMHGPFSGWMVKVNGEFISESAAGKKINGGDKIEWVYVTEIGGDLR